MMKIFVILVLSITLPTFSQLTLSPEIHLDNSVTFRLNAPNAKVVELQCEGVKKRKMQKETSGVWSFTTEVLQHDIYSYTL